MKLFTSESGDDYYIPDPQYAADVAEYQAAVERGDESTMLKYETGETGWRTTPHARDGLRLLAEKASARWSRAQYRRSGTVPTWAEWDAWVVAWMNGHEAKELVCHHDYQDELCVLCGSDKAGDSASQSDGEVNG